MFNAIGWWALPVALLPYSFAHGAFRRFQETRSTYRQTIRALAQIPEVAGLNLTGHSDRTAELAVAMAKELGLSPEEVEDVEFAALMHDIGHITLNDPIVMEQGWTKEDLARWGAEIIAGAAGRDIALGGPGQSLLFYVFYLYNRAFGKVGAGGLQMGYASALAWILFVIILIVTLAQLWLAKRWVHYETDGR